MLVGSRSGKGRVQVGMAAGFWMEARHMQYVSKHFFSLSSLIFCSNLLFGTVWALHGVWDSASSTLLRKDYFQTAPSDPHKLISFIPDYWRPAWVQWAREIRRVHPEAIHFIQPPVFQRPPTLDEEELGGRACVSSHWYDGLTLM